MLDGKQKAKIVFQILEERRRQTELPEGNMNVGNNLCGWWQCLETMLN